MPTNYVIQTIPYTSIKYPDLFLQKLYSGFVDTQQITKLRHFGQISPLLVWQQQPDSYQLLADYTCFQAMGLLGCTHLVCRILPPDISPYHRYSVQIIHGWNEVQASPLFQAHLVQQAQRELSRTEVFSLLSLMGHKPHQHVADELVALLTLADAALLAVHRGHLAVKSVKLLQRLSHQDQESVAELVQLYRPGGSKQSKLVEMLTELALRGNTSIASLLQKWLPVDQTHQVDKVDNSPQQMQHLLRELSAAISPEKTRLDRQFHQFVSSLSLPRNASIAPSPSFEDDSLTLCLHFSNAQALEQTWAGIKTLLQNEGKGRSNTPSAGHHGQGAAR